MHFRPTFIPHQRMKVCDYSNVSTFEGQAQVALGTNPRKLTVPQAHEAQQSCAATFMCSKIISDAPTTNTRGTTVFPEKRYAYCVIRAYQMPSQ